MSYYVYQTVTVNPSGLKYNYSSLQNGDVCETLGYYAPLDGGRAKYLIQTDSSSVDDGGYILRLNSTKIAKLIIENNEINALQYGAHNNWTQFPNEPSSANWSNYDNRTIFANLMTKAGELKSNVYIPKGIYMCNPTKREDTLLPMASNITLRGDGTSTIITMPTIDETIKIIDGIITSPWYSPIFKCPSAKNFIVRDITFDGNRHLKSDGTYFGGNAMFGVWGTEIAFYESSPTQVLNALFENVTCQNCMYAGFRILGANKLTFSKCKALTVDCGFITMGDAMYVSDLTITNCLVDGHSMSEAIALFQNGPGKNIIISNNVLRNKEYAAAICLGFTGTPPTSMDFYNKDVIIQGNVITNFSHGIRTYYASHVTIIGNNISQTGANLIENSQDIIFSNNQIYYCEFNNVQLQGSKHVIINDNLLKDNAPELTVEDYSRGYIFLNPNNSHLSISGNHMYQGTFPSSQTEAIRKFIGFREYNSQISFKDNNIYNEFRSSTIETDTPAIIWLSGTDNDNCVKDSYIEMPPNTVYYDQYPPQMDETTRHSNVLVKRIDEITNYYSSGGSVYGQAATCCIIDPIVETLSNIAIRPVNTRLSLIFGAEYAHNVALQSGGNIHFKTYDTIPNTEKWVIELLSMGTYWLEVSRTKIAV